jgi:hypothetical protein
VLSTLVAAEIKNPAAGDLSEKAESERHKDLIAVIVGIGVRTIRRWWLRRLTRES